MTTFEVEGVLVELTKYFSELIDIVVASTGLLNFTKSFQTGLDQKPTKSTKNTIVPTTNYYTDTYWHRCLELLEIVDFITPDLDSPYTYLFEPKDTRRLQEAVTQKYLHLPLLEINSHCELLKVEYEKLGITWQLHALCTQLLMYRQTSSSLFPIYRKKRSLSEFKKYLKTQPNLDVFA